MKEYVTRFSRRERLEHLAVMTIFIILCVTGLPQKFYTAGLAQAIILGLGGIDRVRWVHRFTGLVFTFLTVVHITLTLGRVMIGRSGLSLVPTRQDFVDAITMVRYYLGTSDVQAKFDRFDYKQKFEYWGVVMGAVIVIGTGLILLFPIAATRILPGEIIPAAKLMHGNEGLFAFLVIILWHMYNAHLNPDVFPFDTTIFTGKISVERMRHEHSLEYDRIKELE
jgi:cytochrome b subunit of formate dehydrogenase